MKWSMSVVVWMMVAGLLSMGTVNSCYGGTYSGGVGTAGDPYQLATAGDWQELAQTPADWSSRFVVTGAIDLAGVADLSPVGSSSAPFTGVLDGGGYVLSAAAIAVPDDNAVGLFGAVGVGGQVIDLGVDDPNVLGVGMVGALVGVNEGTISSCYATGTVSGSTIVGGLVGQNLGLVSSCYVAGSVDGDSVAGGLVGANSGSVQYCHASASVNASIDAGGLIGANSGLVWCSFWDIDTAGVAGSSGGKGLSSSEMTTLSIFRNADWSGQGWVMANGVDVPRLQWEGTGYPSIPPATTVPLLGSGTTLDPYQVWAGSDFALLSWYPAVLDKEIVLMGDIDLASQQIDPIGDLGPFTGVFDGMGYAISNARLFCQASDDVGLFASLGTGGQLLDVALEDPNVMGVNRVGSLVGWNQGGLLNLCRSDGAVQGSGSQVGGLVGRNEGTIESCFASGSVNSDSDQCGGIVGLNQGGVDRSCSTAVVSAEVSVGGVVGRNEDSGTVSSCYAEGTVSGTDSVGGVIGENAGGVSYCYAAGGVSSAEDAGGLIAENDGSVYSSFWDVAVTGQNGSGGGKGLTSLQMITLSVFRNAEWGGDGWVMDDGQDRPRLSWEGTGYPPIPTPSPISLSGTGTPGDPYQLWTANDIEMLSWQTRLLDKHLALKSNIDLSGKTLFPIGDLGPFSGVFDGNGYCLSNAGVNLPGNDDVGFFASLSAEGQVIDLELENATMVGHDRVGVLAGSVHGGQVSGCVVSGQVSGDDAVGGLVGDNDAGEIVASYATAEVTGAGQYAGGLVGLNRAGADIRASYATGVVMGVDDVGGLVGHCDGTVWGSFWDMDTTGQAGSSGGKGLSSSEMMVMSIFRNANWSSYGWVMSDGADLPRLPWEGMGYLAIPPAGPVPLVGTGTEQDPYEIWAAGDFALLSWYTAALDSHIVMMADIDLTWESLTPIGDLGPFTGQFCGNGHVIANGSIDQPANDVVGLFARVDSPGRIANVTVEAVSVVGDEAVGVVAGRSGDASSTGGVIESCHIAGSVSCQAQGGGIVGVNDGTVATCSGSVSVDADDAAGGLVGENAGTLDACYSIGTATGAGAVGAVVGTNHGTVSACFWDTEVSGMSSDPAATGRTTAQLQQAATFLDAGWALVGTVPQDTSPAWRLCVDDVDYPRLAWEYYPSADWYCPDGGGLEDLSHLSGDWGQSDCWGVDDCGGADVDGSGTVDIGDLMILAENWLIEAG